MDWLPVDELPWHFADYLQFPPVLNPVPAGEWPGAWDPPFPVILFDANKRASISDVYGMRGPDQWGRIPVAAEDELFRARFPHTALHPIATRLVDLDQVWMLEMSDDQSVYWSDDTPEWPAAVGPEHFNFDHPVPVLNEPPARPLPRILTRPADQMGVLTGRRGWLARTEPNAWEACVVVSEIYCDVPAPEELEAIRRTQPDAMFAQYVQVMLPVHHWLHRLTGEPMPSSRFPVNRVWL
ncbi:hypothetical protein [Nocardia sp. NPDC051570]|uniref:hypothetical protein n=1 Tax=Nocardia sp. NPDC051570 TaxID=3364324 RepID=UPI00379C3715